jgi:Fe-S-cluster containining protein
VNRALRRWSHDARDDNTRPVHDAVKATRAIYAKADATWARFSCPSSGECCQLAKTKRQPWLWPSEWNVLSQARVLPPPRDDGACPYLDASGRRCTVYEDRPLGCRTFFCHRIIGPAKHPVLEMDALLRRLERVNLDEDESAEARPLLSWYEAARNAS